MPFRPDQQTAAPGRVVGAASPAVAADLPADLPAAVPAEPSRLSRLLLFGALVAIGPLTIDIYLAAFPAVVDDLATTEAVVQLTLTATFVGLATGQLLIGAVSDAVGRRRPLLAALSAYVVVSALIAVTTAVPVLLGLRFLQGLTAAAGMVLSQAMVRDLYSGSVMATFISRLFLIVGVAPIIAPTLGAQFLEFGTWRTIFWALAVFGLVLVLLALWRVRETLPPERRAGRGLSPLLASYAVLLRDRRYIGLVLTACFAMGSLFAYISSATFVFQDRYGLSTQEYAWVFAAGAGSLTLTSQVNGWLVQRFHPAAIVRAALPAGAVVALLLLGASVLDLGVAAIIAGVVALMAVVGFVMPNNPVLALADHGERAGAAAALLGASSFVFGGVISPVSGMFEAASAVPMAGIMVACSLTALVTFWTLARPREILRDLAWDTPRRPG